MKVMDAGVPIERLNELEMIRGEIWANVWQTDYIVRISPKEGRVLGWINLKGLLGAPMAILTGDGEHLTFTYDEDLMVGTDAGAQAALDRLGAVVRDRASSMVLEAGDLLVVDNDRVVHGRTSFAARFDGTDRWLQRAFVVTDLAPSSTERAGRIITTRF